MPLNATHAPNLLSWVPTPPESDFPIQNLPFGVFRPHAGRLPRAGVAIGDRVLDLSILDETGHFNALPGFRHDVFAQPSLNAFLALGRRHWSAIRARLSQLLSADCAELRGRDALLDHALVTQSTAQMLLPVEIGDYTDFYSSIEHATNLGKMFRDPANALLPNWRHIPVGYHGRASSVVVSGTKFHRPSGQTKADDAPAPSFGPSRALDIELEMAFVVGTGNDLGTPVAGDSAGEHIFGMVLMNDWSARDIQKWEYVPLGPFLGKSFATTISPWIVTLEALEPFRVQPPKQEPEPLPYLRCSDQWAFDVRLEALLQTPKMAEAHRLSATNFREMYWTVAQQLAHHTSNGANLRTGDLCGSGTISGPTPDSCGSLIEMTWKGTKPIALPGGETRTYLQDGDTVILRGHCAASGLRIGFGEARGTILPAR